MNDLPFLDVVRQAFTDAKLASVYEDDDETGRVLLAFLRGVEHRFISAKVLIACVEAIWKKDSTADQTRARLDAERYGDVAMTAGRPPTEDA
ncbi:MAG TPA: hypothetical protein VEX11_14770 [Acetobacteraceae bacterium]|nr:hypothetical protein [Acetobacteraceae bacterium]